MKAQSSLNDALGTAAKMISADILDGMATLQNRMGLTAKEAISFAQSALLSGQSVNQLKEDAIGSAAAVEKERGTRLDIRNILKETVGSQDQVAAAYGGFNSISFYPNEKFGAKRQAKDFYGWEMGKTSSAYPPSDPKHWELKAKEAAAGQTPWHWNNQ